jgi:hypothetical protein
LKDQNLALVIASALPPPPPPEDVIVVNPEPEIEEFEPAISS